MKLHLFHFSLIAIMSLVFTNCNPPETNTEKETAQYVCPMDCENGKVYDKPGRCPVCKMNLQTAESLQIPDKDVDLSMSIFNLNTEWTDQNGEAFQLSNLEGKPFLAVMIYTSCQAACPRLVADVKNIKDTLGCEGVNYVLISMNPEEDTPAVLKQYATDNALSGECWTLLTGDTEAAREFSNVVSVKYRKVSETDFSHSNIISLFDQHGILNYQQEGLGVDNSELMDAIEKL